MFVSWLLSKLRREEGQGLTEYALILGAIAVMVVVAFVFLQDAIVQLVSDIANTVGTQVPTPNPPAP